MQCYAERLRRVDEASMVTAAKESVADAEVLMAWIGKAPSTAGDLR